MAESDLLVPLHSERSTIREDSVYSPACTQQVVSGTTPPTWNPHESRAWAKVPEGHDTYYVYQFCAGPLVFDAGHHWQLDQQAKSDPSDSKMVAKLAGIAKLLPGWGGPSSEQPSLDSIDLAYRVIRACGARKFRIDRVVPIASGGVAIYRIGTGRMLSLQCRNGGELLAIIRPLGEGESGMEWISLESLESKVMEWASLIA